MEKYRNKYRIPSARATFWDYSQKGMYFVTICTKNREHYFGEVLDGTMNLTSLGECVYRCWHEIIDHFSFVVLGEFVVMPNHVHGILVFDKPDACVETQNIASDNQGRETQNIASLQTSTPNKFGVQSQNLASVIRGFKIGVTKFAKSNAIEFAWQARFHDHIIRNEKEFIRIEDYIKENPFRWEKDTYYNN